MSFIVLFFFMGNNNFLKVVYIVAFVVLAGYSCWATEHSFHLLFPTVPVPLIWGVTIAFFIVASYGSKMIVDALNTDEFMPNRKAMFSIGTILLIVFWICASMPTNTHTFFYNHKIGGVAIEDLNTTKAYLDQIARKEVTDTAYFILQDDVAKLQNQMVNEFNGIGNTGRRGNGAHVQNYLNQINGMLGSNIPANTNFNSTDPTIINSYNSAIAVELARAKSKYQASNQAVIKAREIIDNTSKMDSAVNEMVYINEIDEDLLKQTEGVLQIGYAHIKNNSQYVRFANDTEMEQYTKENLETKVKRMLSVIDVWIDFIARKYPASFLFYVLISILVDVAAFIFFDLAFKKKDSF